MRNVVVTGVSTGIGKAIVSVMIQDGWRVFGSVRRSADAQALQDELGDSFVPLVFDVEDDQAVIAASAKVRAELAGHTLDGLVNNVGIVLAGPLLLQTVADFRKQIEVNLVGTFAVTRAFAPLLGVDPKLTGPKGRIVNISSVGGKMGPPFLGAYAASKHGLEGFSESLRRELMLVGVDVIVIGPGPVARPARQRREPAVPHHLTGTVWEQPFEQFTEMNRKTAGKGLAQEDIGHVVKTALTAAKPQTRYAPVLNKLQHWIIPTALPSRVVDRLIAARFGLRQR